MTAHSNNFPLFFTLERVLNGYVLTSKYETGSLVDEKKIRKEVVTDDKINTRIGQLLKLESLAAESPVYFHVEAISTKSTGKGVEGRTDKDIDAKAAYAHLCDDGRGHKAPICLQIEETNTLEIYGHEAEDMAKKADFPLFKSGETPYVCVPNSVESRKMVASAQMGVVVKTAKLSYIRQWYESRKVQTEPPSPQEKAKPEAQPTQKKGQNK